MKLFIFHLGTDQWDGAMAAVVAEDLDAAKKAVWKGTEWTKGVLTNYTELEPGEVYQQG